ncbi:hypothetical protein [Anaerovorax odorimutans]|uniref:hypothetical protein n=1 Tax=Anaerovorax odorimutans TaxID=109327 RepID=UPI000429FDE8|nr:hypothetical protein [Anaerovorax odorimutans]
MSSLKSKLAIKKLALQNGTSVEEIIDEINFAIEVGMNNPDNSIQQYWRKIPRKGTKPTPEELISYLAKQVGK